MLSGSGLPTLLSWCRTNHDFLLTVDYFILVSLSFPDYLYIFCLLEGMSLGFFQGTQYTVAVTVLSGIEEEVESLGLHSSTLGNH